MLDFNAFVMMIMAVMAGLVGFPSLLSVLVVALEHWGWLSPDKVDQFNFWANAIVFGGIAVLAFLGKLALVNIIDLDLGSLAKLLTEILIILGIPTSFASARQQYMHLRQGLLGK